MSSAFSVLLVLRGGHEKSRTWSGCREGGGGGFFAKACPTLATPWTVAHQSMEFSRQDSWMSCHSLLQGIFLIQGSNPRLLHCRWTLYGLSQEESPIAFFFLILLPLQSMLHKYRYQWAIISVKINSCI